MDYTTLPAKTRLPSDPETLPVVSLYEALQHLPEPRRAQGKRYELALILCLLILAKLAGQKTLRAATEWIRHRCLTLARQFGLRRPTMPCQMTYCNVVAALRTAPIIAPMSRWEKMHAKHALGLSPVS